MRRGILMVALCALLCPAVASAYTPPPVKHVFVLIDENESEATSFGASSPAQYLSKTLVSEGAFVPNYYGVGHSSLDNYIAMVSGQAPNPSTSADCSTFADFPGGAGLDVNGQQTGSGCVYPSNVPTLMGQLNGAGLTWRAYEDGMGSTPARDNPGNQTDPACGHPILNTADGTEAATATDQYATRHDPFVYFHYVIDNQAGCDANVVPLSQLPTDLASAATTPNYVFITPDLCNDGHDSGGECIGQGGGGLGQADTFLQTWVPKIMASPAYQQNGLLIVTFDEAINDSTSCCGEVPGPAEPLPGGTEPGGGSGGGVVGAVLLSPYIAPGTTTTASYNHYSMLGSVEDLFGLPRIGDTVGTTPFGADIYTRPNGPPTPTPTPVPTPTPTPTPTPAPVITAAQLRGALRSEITPNRGARIAKIVSKRGFSLQLRALESGRTLVQWFQVPRGAHVSRVRKRKPKPVLVGSARATFTAAGTRTVRLTLTRAGKRLLAKKKLTRQKLTAKGTFTPTGGKPVSVTRTFTLTR